MNINLTRPETTWVGNRCYRVICSPEDSILSYEEIECDEEFELEDDDPDISFGKEDKLQIHKTEEGRFRLLLTISSDYFPYIIGNKGSMKQKIEADTHSRITVPYKGMKGDIVLTGRESKNVRQAAIKILSIVSQAKQRQPFTHFVSIPMNDPSIQKSFLDFKAKVLKSYSNSRGIDESIFQDQNKLHLTVGVAVLTDNHEREKAIQQFDKLQSDILMYYSTGAPLHAEVKGIEYMNDDPSEVDVLYGTVIHSSFSKNLQEFCEFITERLDDEVLLKQREEVKLHITLMNTLFRKSKNESEKDTRSKVRETFDARGVLEEFKDFYFGEMSIDEVHLSVRYSKDENGYYKHSAIVFINNED